MAIDDLIDTQVGVAAAAIAAVVSPRARGVMRRGAVYGLAGAMKAGDVAFGAARGAVRGAAAGVSGSGGSSTTTTRTPRSSASSSSRSRSTASKRGTTRSRSSRSNG